MGAAAADLPCDGASTPELRQQLQAATWPADIVRLADCLLDRQPGAASGRETRDLRDRAAASDRLLHSNEVQLQRAAFTATDLPPERQQDLRGAARGDPESALRLARFYERGNDQVPADRYRYLGWLQFASLLGSDAASYEVALYYRREGQPSMAAVYETRAISLGYVPPPALDNVRK